MWLEVRKGQLKFNAPAKEGVYLLNFTGNFQSDGEIVLRLTVANI